MKRIDLYFIVICMLSSCAFHTGNISTGADIDCPIIYTAYGTSRSVRLLGLGGFDKDALIMDAKRDLHNKFPYKKGIKLSNYSADFKNTFVVFFVHITKVTVSADVYDCNQNVSDTIAQMGITEIDPKINGFEVGDSLLFDNYGNGDLNEFLPAILISHSNSSKVKINYTENRIAKNGRKVLYDEIFKTNKDIGNINSFGFDIGEVAQIKIQNSKNNTTTVKNCTIIGLNKSDAIIEYVSDDGKTKRIVVDKVLIKK